MRPANFDPAKKYPLFVVIHGGPAPQFKDALAELEQRMQACIKAGEAVSGTKKWVINGSEKDGAKMVAEFSKLMLRAYNNEADSLVRTMKPYARDTAIERLQKLRTSISKLGRSMQIETSLRKRWHRRSTMP